jgi:hypothetical protein
VSRGSLYRDIIAGATGETDPVVLRELEEVMRRDIFHSTLDWQTREELEEAARLAVRIL